MNLLAIDPGTTSGWAVWADGRFYTGVWHFSGNYGRRFAQMSRKLRDLHNQLRLDKVAYEEPYIHIRKDRRTGEPIVAAATVELGFGWVGHIRSFCAIKRLPEPVAFKAASWRSKAYGKGKVKPPKTLTKPSERKDWHIQNAFEFCRKHGLVIRNGDEAEAFGMLWAFKSGQSKRDARANRELVTGQSELII